jgi:hypothetical protein
MKCLATVLAIFGLMAITTNANAFWTSEIGNTRVYHASKRHWDRPASYEAKAHPRRFAGHYGGSVSGVCWQAARLGGPCGCEASRIAFGEPIRDLWLVSNWFRFPRTSAHVGAAAIWGRHHVEIVVAVNGDGTVDTRGSVGFSHVPIYRLTFVEPSGARVHKRYAGI